ncbi:MAG: (2Fe-2S)-binding protein [Bdellovibrionales bacterium]|nr:(2Fe-2S)-binding protein [Bdellovibrionales bacterium]
MSEFKCTLWPTGEVLTLNGEETLLKQLKETGKKIKSSCGGCATCTDCMIVVKSGEMNLTPQTFEELRLLGNVFHITKERLSCQTRITGDVTLDISAHEKGASSAKGANTHSSGPKSTTTILKKKEEVAKAVRENEEKSREKPSEDWYRHWESSEADDPSKPKKLGGGKKPKAFNYSENDDSDKKDND